MFSLLDNGYVLKQAVYNSAIFGFLYPDLNSAIWLPEYGSTIFGLLYTDPRIHNIWLTVSWSTDPQYLASCIQIHGSAIFGFLYPGTGIRNIWLPVSGYTDPQYLASCIRIHGSAIFGFLCPDPRIRIQGAKYQPVTSYLVTTNKKYFALKPQFWTVKKERLK